MIAAFFLITLSLPFVATASLAAASTTEEDAFNETHLDCRMRVLALRFAQELQPWHSYSSCYSNTHTNGEPSIDSMMMRRIHDALELSNKCHVPFHDSVDYEHPSSRTTNINCNTTTATNTNTNSNTDAISSICQDRSCIFVDPNSTEYQQHTHLMDHSISIKISIKMGLCLIVITTSRLLRKHCYYRGGSQ